MPKTNALQDLSLGWNSLHWLWRGAVVLGLGVCAGLGHPPYDAPWMTILALAGFMVVHRNSGSLRQVLWQGWAFGVGYFAFTLRWILEPFMVDAAQDGWMAPFALIIMASGFALFWMLAAGGARRIGGQSILAFAICLTLAEMTRALILTGFPWGLLGHVLIDTPFAQLAAFGGPHLLTFLTTCAAMALVCVATAGWQRWAGLGMLLALVAGWPLLTVGPAPTPQPDAPVVRLIQPNAPQDQKWDPVMGPVFMNRMLDFTGQGDVPDLIVWPESAVPSLMEFAFADFAEMSDAARGAPLIVGINRRDGSRYYNSFVLLGRGGLIDSLYDKRHLVPFGEYFPGGELLNRIGIPYFASSRGGGFTPGDVADGISVPGIGIVRPLICYEGIFAEEVGSTENRPRAMVLITNDAWFGQDAGPFQHLAQARLRAIEQGVPMVRVANTGVSAMIDARGRVTGRIALNTAGYIDLPLPPIRAATLYQYGGDLPVLILLLMLMGVSHLVTRRHRVVSD